MLENMNDMLNKAWKEGYAVPAFDCTEDILISSILDTCQEMNSPVILMALEDDLEGKGIDYITSIIKGVSHRYSIPIALHLDHATDLDLIKKCIHYGFTSVMYDGSSLSFEENIKNTKEVVDYAKDYNVSVEAELGRVGGSEAGGEDMGESTLTEAKDVERFLEETGVDALAVSIGTSHGIYVSEPELNIPVLKDINRISQVPLVLHGGSGTPFDQVQEAVENGIAKVNLYADLRIAMYKGLNKAANKQDKIDPLPDEMLQPIKDELRKVIIDKIDMLKSKNRA